VVSAVGHEVDFSVSDFVADLRAATPTEAGEKVVPDVREVRRSLQHLSQRVAGSLQGVVRRSRQRLSALARRHVLRHPEVMLRERTQRLDDLLESMQGALERRLEVTGRRLDSAGAQLHALSPLRVLERGYSVTFGPDGSVLRSVEGLEPGDQIATRVHEGRIRSSVHEVTRAEPGLSDEGENDA
jgi:exodeoxyribonuclease VII large subunit